MSIKGYKRKPIVMNHDTIMLLQLFKRREYILEDMWISDYILEEEEYRDNYERAAKQFFKQLEGEECGAFVMALLKECFQSLKEHDDFAGTNWVAENLIKINKLYKNTT